MDQNLILKSHISNQNFIHNISNEIDFQISTGFRDLAYSKECWQGEVGFRGNTDKMGRVIGEFLSDGVTCLYLIGRLGSEGRTKISAQDIIHMGRKCKNLEVLVIGCVRVESWPKQSETVPLTSLKQLSLLNVEMNTDLFSGVGLHHIMPNLEIFCILVTDDFDEGSEMRMPEFEHCKNLWQICLRSEAFPGPYLINSLPSSLEYMDMCCLVPDSSWESFMKVIDE